MYGKIYGGIQFGSATYPERMPLQFLYYLNASRKIFFINIHLVIAKLTRGIGCFRR